MKPSLRFTRLIALLCLFSLGLGAGTALSAPGKGKGKSKGKAAPASPGKGKPGKNRSKSKGAPTAKPIPPGQAKKLLDHSTPLTRSADWKKAARFKDQDRSLLSTFFGTYKNHPHGLPPGLAKNLQRGKPLPPGWQKKIEPGWTVDNTWWNYFQPVPPAYLPSTFHHPKDTGLYLIGDRLVRVHQPRREVIDVMHLPSILLKR